MNQVQQKQGRSTVKNSFILVSYEVAVDFWYFDLKLRTQKHDFVAHSMQCVPYVLSVIYATYSRSAKLNQRFLNHTTNNGINHLL